MISDKMTKKASNIGHTIYLELVKRAERGHRVSKVTLPPALHEEWIEEGHNINSLFKAIGVTVVQGEVDAPLFEEGAK